VFVVCSYGMPKYPDDDGLIQCTKCERELPGDVEHFHRRGDGFRYRCKECRGSSFGVNDINKVKDAKDGHKFCSSCHKELPATREYFYAGGKSSNGLTSQCKKCMDGSEYGVHNPNSALEGKDGHRFCVGCESQLPATREYFFKGGNDQLNGKCKECLDYEYGIHRPNRGRDDGKWTCSTCGEVYEATLEYFPPGNNGNGLASRCRDCESTRKHRLRSERRDAAVNELTGAMWREIREVWDNECAYCGESSGTLQRDHVVPINNGGDTVPENIVPACGSCNASKRDSSVVEWYPNQPFYDETREKQITHITYDQIRP